MKKQLTEKTVYEPNENVKVAVENKPTEIGGSIVYAHKVTITINAGAGKDKLSFSTDEDIAKFVETIDFEDPQTALGV
jgi:hypothetical protein